jgi:hypothetical protein
VNKADAVEEVIGMSIAGIGLAIIGTAWLSRKISRSRFVIRRYENRAYKRVKCKECTGGAEYLDPVTGHWGKIPISLRIIHPGREPEGQEIFESRQANIRACSTCRGMGFLYTRNRNVPDRGWQEELWITAIASRTAGRLAGIRTGRWRSSATLRHPTGNSTRR